MIYVIPPYKVICPCPVTFSHNIHMEHTQVHYYFSKNKKNPAQFSGLLEWLHLQGNDPLGRQETSLDHTAGNTEN